MRPDTAAKELNVISPEILIQTKNGDETDMHAFPVYGSSRNQSWAYPSHGDDETSDNENRQDSRILCLWRVIVTNTMSV
jgi:hypothetical protein